jgi:hypothetical protein
MADADRDDDGLALHLERRWFAAERAAAEAKVHCDTLSQVLELARSEWMHARMRLAHLEALRDGFCDEIAAIDEGGHGGGQVGRQRSAA